MRPYATSVCGRELLVYEAFGCSCTYWWPAATLQQVELTESFSQLHLLEQVNKQAGAELQQKWQEQQRTAADARRAAAAAAQRYSLSLLVLPGQKYAVYLLYSYKSTDARRAAAAAAKRYSVYLLYWYKSTQFTCFTCTKVRMRGGPAAAAQRYSVYLLWWYKSTNTDTCGAARQRRAQHAGGSTQDGCCR
jgi:hypothetical protein